VFRISTSFDISAQTPHDICNNVLRELGFAILSFRSPFSLRGLKGDHFHPARRNGGAYGRRTAKGGGLPKFN
jgi:hypothetical protein